MKLLNKLGLQYLLTLLKPLFGKKLILDDPKTGQVAIRTKYLLDIDYDTDLKIDWEPVTINGFELPTQTQSNLRITSLYNVVQKGNVLEVE